MSELRSSQERKSLLDWFQTILLPIVLALYFRFGPTTLPDYLSVFIGVALVLTILATAVDTVYPYVKGLRRKHGEVSLPSQREEFRAFIVEVKANTESKLWLSLSYMVKESDVGIYAAIVYALLADVSSTLGRIYASFEPSMVSHDLLESYRERLSRLHLEHAEGIMLTSMNVKSNELRFTRSTQDMSKFLKEISRDVVNKSTPRTQS